MLPGARTGEPPKPRAENSRLRQQPNLDQHVILEEALSSQWRSKINTTQLANELRKFLERAEQRAGGPPRGRTTTPMPTTSITHNGKTAKTAKQRANLLAEYFSRRYEPEGAPPLDTGFLRYGDNPPPVTAYEVLDAIRGMKNTAPGRDGVSQKARLKLTSSHRALAAVFTFSLTTGHPPVPGARGNVPHTKAQKKRH